MKQIHFLLIVLFFVSCKNKATDANCPTINVNITSNIKELDADTILIPDSVELIALQSKGNIPIGEIEIFKSDGNKIVIVDDEKTSVFIFNNKGSLVNVIHAVGKANNEYFEIADVCLEGDYVYILDYRKSVVLKYTVLGKFIKSINIEKYWGNQMALKNGKIYLINDYSETDTGKYEVFIIDENGNLIDKFLPFDYTYMATPPVSCHQNNGEIMVVSHNNNTIYSIKDDNCIPVIRLDFGSKQLPEKYFKKDLRELTKENVLNKYILGIKRLQFSEKFILLDFNDDAEDYTILYNRITGKSTMTKGLTVNSSYQFGLSKFYVCDDYVYEIMDAPELLFLYENVFKQQDNRHEPYKTNLKELVNGLKESDNPILFKYKLK